MTYQLYYFPGAASMAVHWMLLELGVPFETIHVDLASKAQKNAAYRRLNPSGQVPTLVVDHIPYRESTALLMLLAERHPDAGLMPLPGTSERANWLETMIFLANTLLPAMRDWFYADEDGDPAGADIIRCLAQQRIEAAWTRLDARLADRRYLVGDRVGTADFLAIMLMRWARNMPRPATTWPHLETYVRRLSRMASFVEVNRRENLEDWPSVATKSSISIRLARQSDVPFLPDIERSAAQAFRQFSGLDWIADDTPLPEKTHQSSLASGTCWVAVDQLDRPVGFLSASLEGDALHILEMSVMTTEQGRGIGTALVKAAQEWAQQRDLAAITLTTFHDIPWNAPFYTRLGFRTLTDETLDGRLSEILHEERQHGFPAGSRCAMRLLLQKSTGPASHNMAS